MSIYLKFLGFVLIAGGLCGSLYCWNAATRDDAYFQALKGLEKYPGNVLYQTEFKMAEPRHMLLLGGAYGAGSVGLVLGSLCLGMGQLLSRSRNA
jgi:hypothetical protein